MLRLSVINQHTVILVNISRSSCTIFEVIIIHFPRILYKINFSRNSAGSPFFRLVINFGIMVRVFANDPGDLGRVIPKT